MLIKSVIALSLIISFGLLVSIGLQPPLNLQNTTTEVKVKHKNISKRNEQVKLYPAVGKPLPDLYEGYLFNEERLLVREDDVKEEDTGDTHQGIRVNIEDVMYVGSLIIGDTRKGLISYPNKPQPAKSTKSSKLSRTRTRVPKRTIKRRNYAQVLVGETFSDYKVVAVESDRIEFAKGGKTIVKQLYDPEKKRLTLPGRVSPVKKSTTTNKSMIKKKKAVVSKRKRLNLGTTADLEHGFPPLDMGRGSSSINNDNTGNRNPAIKKPATSILPKPKL
jgi:hypothetical protein